MPLYPASANGLHATFELEPSEECIVREVWKENVYFFRPEPGMYVLDIGANKGVYSVFAVKHGAYVAAYEPHPQTFQALLANVKMNGAGLHVASFNEGVWVYRGTQILHQDNSCSGGSSMLIGDGPEVSIETITLETAIGNREWDIVKLDAEGIEFDVIANTTDYALRLIRRFTIEVHNNIGTLAQYERMMERLEPIFKIDGVREASGRWNYIYAVRR